MKVYTPKDKTDFNYKTDEYNLFLAGTIDDGKSEDWQSKTIEQCKNHQYADKLVIFNPRNPDWDHTIQQTDSDPNFRKQVDWEQDCLEYADIIFMYIAGNSTSIISMMELGQYCKSRKLIISAEPNYFRRGNIEVLARRNNIPLFDNLQDGLNRALDEIFSPIYKELTKEFIEKLKKHENGK